MSAIAGCVGLPGVDYERPCRSMLYAQRDYGCHKLSTRNVAEATFGGALSGHGADDDFDATPLIEGDRFLLVADIRLDNRDELIRDLDAGAAQSRHETDSSILFRAWIRWKERCLDRIVGDFAFAVWDEVERTLTLARDHTGQRPLFYARKAGLIAFSSMPSGLLGCPLLRSGFDYEKLALMLVGATDSSETTYFEGINRVCPGHVTVFSATSQTERRYWTPPRDHLSLSPGEYVEAYRAVLDQAVGARMRRKVTPLGVHLSSGYDSSAVAATAARLSGESRPFAFTAAPRLGFDGPVPRGRIADESRLAALTANLHGMEHIVVRPTTGVLTNLRRHAALYQEPDRNIINAEWWSAILCTARDLGISTLLTGQAGNLTLHAGGLPSLADWVHAGQWRTWWSEARAAAARSDVRWRGVLMNSFEGRLAPSLVRGLNRVFKGAVDTIEHSFMRDQWLGQCRSSARNSIGFRATGDSYQDRLNTIRVMDVGVFRKGALAEAGIDGRDPMADRRLIDFSFTLPPDQLLHRGVSRPLARRALADRVPAEVLNAPLRGYQGADWYERLNRAEAYAVLEEVSTSPAVNELLDLGKIRRAIEDWPSEGSARQRVRTIYRTGLMIALSTAVFLQLFESSMRGSDSVST